MGKALRLGPEKAWETVEEWVATLVETLATA